ncbi:hypothetical protein ONZ51_g12202 [Trametes cubensis]|uniref:HMA domain-containing protein n=1 Tax=Trametes cubensis TaxID=1111947 RepID=A0AAD7TIQ6_9APHY|nr:hypothetical protein ONZ51_g12202 [Trametes cubensis]
MDTEKEAQLVLAQDASNERKPQKKGQISSASDIVQAMTSPSDGGPSISAPNEQDGSQRVALSVDGMTCASCINTITGLLSDIPGVPDIVVSLLGKSATAVIPNAALASQLAEAINDGGYEAEVVSVQPLHALDAQATEETGPRTVSLRVEGTTSVECVSKITLALKALDGDITVEEPPAYHNNPVVTISDPPARYAATIHRPPSLEDRARDMQRRELTNLLLRLASAVVVAIPTFILGIVYMSLVPSGDHTRRWLEEPIWAGNVSRGVWALFILATPVMFYSAGMFHRRCLKEIYALWKKGSRVPVCKRFVKFGSMNLLVSTGVSVSYFASVALLRETRRPTSILWSSSRHSSSQVRRSLEAFSKGRAADAITALGKLRPTVALLVVAATSAEESAIQSTLSSLSEADVEKGVVQVNADKDHYSLPGTKVEKINTELLEVGDVVRVLNGASPPADGTVVTGDGGAFDESSLTGESRLVKKQVGDKVFVGTINKAGVVDIRVDQIGGQTMLDHIVQVVREGQTRRAPIERISDVIIGLFVPVVTLLACITWIIWLGLGFGGALPPDYLDIAVGGWAVWSLEFAIAVFVVACPCGIALAAPTALLVGSGLAAQYGILARGGGEAFQEAAQLDAIVFDKTGTLTEGGEPKVTDSQIFEVEKEEHATGSVQLSKERIMGLAMELEAASSHPLACAIRGYCKENRATSLAVSDIVETPGRGLEGSCVTLDCSAIIGNEAWMEEHRCPMDGHISELLYSWKSQGKSVALLAVCPAHTEMFVLVGAFAIADPIRPEAKEVIARLQDQGLVTWMISGDNALTARAVARSVGIPETNVIAEVLPHQKAEKVRWLQQVGVKRPPRGLARMFGRRRLNERCIVAMVGDGINDAPALAAADVGIAIGSGSDVAISSAAFILVSSNLRALLTLADLSRTVFNRVKFNFFWASVYNLIALPVAAGVIYPAGHARLAPVWASLAMALSSVSVVCSSLLLRLYREPKISST